MAQLTWQNVQNAPNADLSGLQAIRNMGDAGNISKLFNDYLTNLGAIQKQQIDKDSAESQLLVNAANIRQSDAAALASNADASHRDALARGANQKIDFDADDRNIAQATNTALRSILTSNPTGFNVNNPFALNAAINDYFAKNPNANVSAGALLDALDKSTHSRSQTQENVSRAKHSDSLTETENQLRGSRQELLAAQTGQANASAGESHARAHIARIQGKAAQFAVDDEDNARSNEKRLQDAVIGLIKSRYPNASLAQYESLVNSFYTTPGAMQGLALSLNIGPREFEQTVFGGKLGGSLNNSKGKSNNSASGDSGNSSNVPADRTLLLDPGTGKVDLHSTSRVGKNPSQSVDHFVTTNPTVADIVYGKDSQKKSLVNTQLEVLARYTVDGDLNKWWGRLSTNGKFDPGKLNALVQSTAGLREATNKALQAELLDSFNAAGEEINAKRSIVNDLRYGTPLTPAPVQTVPRNLLDSIPR